MQVEPGVIDANILVYAADTGAAQHAVSDGLLKTAQNPSTVLYLTSQILCEFYSVATNPRRMVAPFYSSEAIESVSALLAMPGIHLLPTPTQAIVGWMDLLRRNPVTGARVFDLQIVATMQANHVQRIYTFNAADFAVFPELTVVVPKQGM